MREIGVRITAGNGRSETWYSGQGGWSRHGGREGAVSWITIGRFHGHPVDKVEVVSTGGKGFLMGLLLPVKILDTVTLEADGSVVAIESETNARVVLRDKDGCVLTP
jgi:hypothetical protein